MALRVTYHKLAVSTDQNGLPIGILGKQIGGQSIAVSGLVANGAAATEPCLAHVKAGENCYIAVGAAGAAAANIASSFPLDSGERETRYLAAGEILSVIAA